jgi:gamma-glutamyltranspeptidase/glutathione hydrolase
MLDKGYAASLRARIAMDRAAPASDLAGHKDGDTIYLATGDADGMMVSFIQSNYRGMGSGLAPDGLGFGLQDRGAQFSLDPKHANAYAPRKRPFHTIIPGFMPRAGAPVAAFGVMGGDMQPQGHLQTVVRMLDYKQQPQAACDAPRWRWNGGILNTEEGMPEATVSGLRGLGHTVESFTDSYQDYGAGQFIWRLGDPAVEGYAAASDPRRDGQAAGY